jgi:DNA helicase-2/ATP-dependent DNA helicase PcrA
MAGQMNWSPFQNAIFEAVEKTNDSLIIEAVAGSGKTSTIVEAIKHVPPTQTVVFLAFNKTIADELKRRITAPNARCMTLHAAGFSAWRKYLGGNSWECKVDSNKTQNIVKETLDSGDRFRYGGEMSKLIGLAKGAGIVPLSHKETYTGLVEDDDAVWEDMIDFYELDRDNCSLELAREVLGLSIEYSTTVINYDDMLYQPIISSAIFDKSDVIFLDESQDVNGIQMEIVDRMRKPTSRVIAVGDRHQSCYGFRGALSDSMDRIAARFKCRSLPLSISYRCPKAVVKKAQEFVSHIQSHESAEEGLVVEGVPKWPLNNFRSTDSIICRNSKPLIEMAFLLIRNKISCKVLGRDIGQGLIKLIKKMRAVNVVDLISKLKVHRQKELVKARLKGDEDKIAPLDDKIETIHVFIDEVGIEADIPALVASIEALFSDETAGRLTLSTIHKAKGLEYDRVFILDPFLMPSKYARQKWQIQQEINLQYIAVTRAKRETYYVTSDVLRSEEWLNELDGSSVSQPSKESLTTPDTFTDDSEVKT